MRREPLVLIDTANNKRYPITCVLQDEAVAEIDGEQVYISDSSIRIKIRRQPNLIPIIRRNSGLQAKFRGATYGVENNTEGGNHFILTCKVERH